LAVFKHSSQQRNLRGNSLEKLPGETGAPLDGPVRKDNVTDRGSTRP